MPQSEHSDNSELSVQVGADPTPLAHQVDMHAQIDGSSEPAKAAMGRRKGYNEHQLSIIKAGRERGAGAKKIVSENADAGLTLNGVKAAIKRIKADPQAAGGEKCEPAKRHRTQRTAEKVEQVRALLADNPSATLSQIKSEVGLSRTTTQRVIKNDLQLKSLQQVTMHHVGASHKQKRLDRCAEWLEKMDHSYDLDPRTAFWTDEKIFRLGQCAGGNQNWRVWVHEATAKGDVPLELIRREGGAFQGGALVMCCLGASWRGMGTPRFIQQGKRLNAEKYMDLLENT